MYTRPSSGTAAGMKRLALNELPDIPVCQPADFDFPKGNFGKTMRSCQASWFKQFKFLHYDEAK